MKRKEKKRKEKESGLPRKQQHVRFGTRKQQEGRSGWKKGACMVGFGGVCLPIVQN